MGFLHFYAGRAVLTQPENKRIGSLRQVGNFHEMREASWTLTKSAALSNAVFGCPVLLGGGRFFRFYGR